jgi:hypothetical protein
MTVVTLPGGQVESSFSRKYKCTVIYYPSLMICISRQFDSSQKMDLITKAILPAIALLFNHPLKNISSESEMAE